MKKVLIFAGALAVLYLVIKAFEDDVIDGETIDKNGDIVDLAKGYQPVEGGVSVKNGFISERGSVLSEDAQEGHA
jgi:hypothetical protein